MPTAAGGGELSARVRATRGGRRVAAAAIAALTVALGGCADGRVTSTQGVAEQGFVAGDGLVSVYPVAERVTAPAFQGPLLGEAGSYALADDLGKVVVLNVWGSWCAPCRKEASGLERVYEGVRDEGVRFVGVNVRDPSERPALAFVEEFGVSYPSVYDPKGEALLAFRDTVPPAAIPSTLVVDRAGRLAARVIGPVTQSALQEVVDAVLTAGE